MTLSNKLTRRGAVAGGAILAAGALAMSFRGHAASTFKPSMSGPRTLNRGNGAEPDSLDPHKIQGNWEANIVGDMFMGLMTEDASAMPVPGAAESYTVSQDGLVYAFNIRDHNWSDGKAVTAHDFVYAFRRIANPKTAAQYVAILYPIENMQQAAEGKLPPDKVGVRALDDKTLEMRFIFQVPYLPQLLMHQTAMPVPAHVVEKHGDAWIEAQNIVTNGPYVLEQWLSNDHIRLVKNPQFYARDSVAIENVYYFPTQDSSAAIKRFRGGEFDLLTDTMPPQQVDWLKRTMPREVRLSPYMLSQYFQFNLKAKPFDDVRVRTALSLAIDRKIICDKVMRGGETPAYAFVPPTLPGYPSKAHLRFKSMAMPARAAEARRLLTEAGFGPDNPLAFDFNTMNTTESKIVAVAFQEMWRQIGLQARIVPSESQVHYALMRKHDFAVGWSGWIADYRDAKDYLFLMQSSTTDLNYSSYASPRYDALMDKSDLTADPQQRFAILQQAEQTVLDDAAIVPVFFGVTRNLVSPQVKGWVDNSVNFHRSRWLSLDRKAAMV